MTVSSINAYYSAQAYSLGFNTLNGKAQSSTPSPNSTQHSLLQSYAASGGALGGLSPILGEVLSEMGLGSNDSVTFRDMLDYRDMLRQSFEEQTKSGLRELGVDENVSFQVISDGEGGVKIITESEDKGKIERFFTDNPNLVTLFNKIESLTNVEAARKNGNIDIEATRRRIEVESMTAWFTGAGQGVGTILNFSGAQSVLLAGLNRTV